MKTIISGLGFSLLLVACSSVEQSASLGSKAPARLQEPLSVVTMDGQAMDLDQALDSGQSVALVFWQTWCTSCLAEMPHLDQAARELTGRVQFVGIVPGPDDRVDDVEVRDVVGRHALSYPQVRDRDLVLTHRFQVEGTPTIIVIAPDRSVVFEGHRSPDWTQLVPTEAVSVDQGKDCEDGVCSVRF